MPLWSIYGTIALAGLVFLSLLLVFGGKDWEGTGDDFGHADGVDVAGGGHIESFDISGWLSTKVLAAFAVGFGAAGMIADLLGAVAWQSGLAGVSVGFVMAGVVRFLVKAFTKSEVSTEINESSMLNKTAVVTQTILPGRIGEVEVNGQYRSARSSAQVEIRNGTTVRVTALGAVFTVEPVADQKA